MGYGIYSNCHFPPAPHTINSPRLLPSHSGAANDYQCGRMALVVSGMSCLPGDGITLWSWRPLCDQLTSVRSLNNYSLVTTSGAWSPGHCITSPLNWTQLICNLGYQTTVQCIFLSNLDIFGSIINKAQNILRLCKEKIVFLFLGLL